MAVETAVGPEGNLLEPGPDALPPARAPDAGAAQRGAREDPRASTAARPRRGSRPSRCPSSSARRTAAPGLRKALEDLRWKASRVHRRGLQHHRPLRPRPRRRATRPSRRCWRSRRSHHHLDPRGHPHAHAAWCSRPASRARCTTSRCSSATAPAPSTRTWPSRPSTTWCRAGHADHGTDDERREELHQGASTRAWSRSISKMGISTIQSYRGAQIFEAIGLDQDVHRRVLHLDRRRASAASAST